MSMLKGITITYINLTQSGVDGFNKPIYEETEESVENVLVYPLDSSNIPDRTALERSREAYTLAIPKGDTHNWENCKVRFFGKTFKSVGLPERGIEDLIPLRWHYKVEVERFE